MAERIHAFSRPFTHAGRSYAVAVYGEPEGHLWYGWLVFVPAAGGPVLRTPRETSQPSRAALAYWTGGLAPRYLEGAFQRTLRASRADHASRSTAPDAPAALPAAEAVLWAVEDYLRQQRGRGQSGA